MIETTLHNGSAASFSGDALVVGYAQGADGLSAPLRRLDGPLDGALAAAVASGEITGETNEVTTLHTFGRLPVQRLVVVGLGQRDALTPERLRGAAGVAARALRRLGTRRGGWALPGAELGLDAATAARAIVEGTLLGLYRFTDYLTKLPGATLLERVILLSDGAGDHATIEDAMRVGQAMAEGTATARDLVNEPPNVLTPRELARRAEVLAAQVGLTYEALGPDEMRAAGMGALLGVAMGSAQPPRLIVVRYTPEGSGAGQAPIGLIGKGITFDTGGISLKPGADMHLMKGDMGGAAAVLGAMHTIALLKPRRPVTAVIASAENMPGPEALRPGDVVRAMNGTTIEVQNTDAEGRLVLADALCYARSIGLTPLVDVATLTGAIVVALGPFYAGIFSNDEALGADVARAAGAAGERMWPMPIDDDYTTLLKSDCADMRNVGGREGGAIIGAMFIGHFADKAPWAHLDIAGVNYATAEAGYQPKGGTGVAARTLAQLVLDRDGEARV